VFKNVFSQIWFWFQIKQKTNSTVHSCVRVSTKECQFGFKSQEPEPPNLTPQTRYPHNLNVPTTMQLSFTPLASCYATMAIRELLQTSTSVGFPFLHFVLKFTAPNRSCAKHKSLPTDLSSWNAIFHSCSLASVCNKHHPCRKKRKITSYFLQVAFHKTL